MLSASVCHFYSGMPLHKRADALAAVSGWVANALVLRDRFAVVCSERGVVRVVSFVADSAGSMAALDAAGGRDNVSLILVDVVSGGLAMPTFEGEDTEGATLEITRPRAR